MSVALWTDSDGKVVRKHYSPNEIDTSDADFVADPSDFPEAPDNPDWVDNTLYYTESDGVHFRQENPFDGLLLTDTQKQEIYDTVQQGDLVKLRNLLENLL